MEPEGSPVKAALTPGTQTAGWSAPAWSTFDRKAEVQTKADTMAVSSNGLGTLSFKQCNAGSNPVTATCLIQEVDDFTLYR